MKYLTKLFMPLELQMFADGTDQDNASKEKELEAKIQELEKANGDLKKEILEVKSNTETPEEIAKKKQENLKSLRAKLTNTDQFHPLSNLEYVSTVLDYRKALMEDGQDDPFLPRDKSKVTSDDISKAKNTAKVLEDCVKEANGRSAVFDGILNEVIAEDSIEIKQMLAKHKQMLEK